MAKMPRPFDQEYVNWIYCSVALGTLKESLFLYLDSVVWEMHQTIKKAVITELGDDPSHYQCGDCSWRQIHDDPGTETWSVNCKNKICSVWLNEILKYHDSPRRFHTFFKNAKPSMWPSDPYEVARLFVPWTRRHIQMIPEELDLVAMILMMKYCKIFHCDFVNLHLLDEIVSIRNNVFHCGDLRVTNADKMKWIGTLLMFIGDLNVQGTVASELILLQQMSVSDIPLLTRIAALKKVKEAFQKGTIQYLYRRQQERQMSPDKQGMSADFIKKPRLSIVATGQTENYPLKTECNAHLDFRRQSIKENIGDVDFPQSLTVHISSIARLMKGSVFHRQKPFYFMAEDDNLGYEPNTDFETKALLNSVAEILDEVLFTKDTQESLTIMELTIEEEREAVILIKTSVDACKAHLKALTKKISSSRNVRDMLIGPEVLKVWKAIEDLQDMFHHQKQTDREDNEDEGKNEGSSDKATSKDQVSEEDIANMISEGKFIELSEIIKSSIADIKHVWFGYRKDTHEHPILVVVLFNGGCKLSREDLPKPFHTYTCLFRHEYEVSDEARKINNDPVKMEIAETDRIKIETILHDNIDELLKRCSNIEMVNVSGVRSRNYGSSNPELIKEVCIVIYVHVKGIIPIGEDEFRCGDIPIDVREGKFYFYDNIPKAKEYHRNLVMGCQIVGTNEGTLGGFFDLPLGGVACLTCAHLFLTEEEGRQFLNGPASEQERLRKKVPWQTIRVRQPDHKNNFGTVRSVILRPGSSTEVGIDAAIVTITDYHRLPTSGRFPKDNREITGYPPENPMQFHSGKCLEIDRNNEGCEVLKFGACTDITRGLMDHEFLLVGQSNIQGISYGYTLYNQMAVRPLKDFSGFAAPGDSGALVFMATNGNRNDLAAIGMVVGGSTAGLTFVTPIKDVLRAFKLDRIINTVHFRSFDQHPTQQIVTLEHLKQEQEQQRKQIKEQNDKMEKGFQEMNMKIENLPRKIMEILQEKNESK